MKPTVLILPGLSNSGPLHWQTLWEQHDPAFKRVQQRDWENPDCAEWAAALEREVEQAGPDVVLVAHSLACLLVAHWAHVTKRRIKGALLVAPPDPEAITFPEQATGFSALPREPLPFASIVVCSADDPFGSCEFAAECAAAWGSRLVELGALGHINAESGLGRWDQGLQLLASLVGACTC